MEREKHGHLTDRNHGLENPPGPLDIVPPDAKHPPFLPPDHPPPPPALAQGPSADWRTFSTPHFRVHYPAPSEDWARRAAARLESIRERVVEEVGYAPPEVVDVLVSDPVADANGEAFPFLGWPRMVLWTSPPGPESVLGHYSDWSELLVVHEETHLVHLLRPSRNPLRRTLARAVPVGPIALAPRWVSEGTPRLSKAGSPAPDGRTATCGRRSSGAGPREASSRATAASPGTTAGRGCPWPTSWGPPTSNGWRRRPAREASRTSGRG